MQKPLDTTDKISDVDNDDIEEEESFIVPRRTPRPPARSQSSASASAHPRAKSTPPPAKLKSPEELARRMEEKKR